MAKLKMKCFRSTCFLTVDFLYPVLILTANFQIFGKPSSEGGAAIKGGRGAGKADKTKQVSVGKRGSIIISKELVESLGIGTEDKFTTRKTKVGIALKKVG
jgi:hypothetical protein